MWFSHQPAHPKVFALFHRSGDNLDIWPLKSLKVLIVLPWTAVLSTSLGPPVLVLHTVDVEWLQTIGHYSRRTLGACCFCLTDMICTITSDWYATGWPQMFPFLMLSVLQLRLQQRRTREQLVDQGIMPRKEHHPLFIALQTQNHSKWVQ